MRAKNLFLSKTENDQANWLDRQKQCIAPAPNRRGHKAMMLSDVGLTSV